MAKTPFPYTHKVTADRIGDGQMPVTLVPEQADLDRIAKAYDVKALESLKAELTIKPWRKAGVRVVGTISAEICQVCVVTLEPFTQLLSDDVDRTFDAASSRSHKLRDLNEDGEIEIDVEGIDPPDIMMDGVIDLGALICEQLALNIDPFPRKPDAVFESHIESTEDDDDAGDESNSPFAALAGMKPETDKKS